MIHHSASVQWETDEPESREGPRDHGAGFTTLRADTTRRDGRRQAMTKVVKTTRCTRRRILQAGVATMAAPWLVPALAIGAEASQLPGNGPSPGELKVGFSQLDITPPVGAIITGPALPVSVGMDDPLRARAMVVQSGDRKLAIVGLDLVKIRRDLADAAIAQASARTGIARDAVLICPSHNHSSPLIPAQGDSATANKDYLSTLPKRIADSIEQANKALQPARMFIGRSLVYEGHHNRRVVSKSDGLVLNTWLKKLNDLEQVPQVLGTEGPIDPELWVARFDALDGRVLGTLVNFTCHPALHDRTGLKTWSADFPGVIADKMAEAYGKESVCVFTQGASGNIAPPVQFTPDWRERSAVFAKAAVEAAKKAIPVKGPVAVGYARRDVTVPRCNPAAQRDEAITRLGWRPESFQAAKRDAAKHAADSQSPRERRTHRPTGHCDQRRGTLRGMGPVHQEAFSLSPHHRG